MAAGGDLDTKVTVFLSLDFLPNMQALPWDYGKEHSLT